MDEKKLTDELTELAIEKTNEALKVSKELSHKYNKFVDDNIENIVQMSKARKWEKEMILEFIHRLQRESQKQYEDYCLLEAENSVLRQAKDNLEIEVSDYQDKLHDLDCENAEQKATIERLTELCEIAEGTKNRLTMFDGIAIHDKAVKDTAIKCLTDIEDCINGMLDGERYMTKNEVEYLLEHILNKKQEYGVEVE